MNQDLMVFTLEIIYKKKDGAYIINLDEYSYIGTHWVALYVQNNVLIILILSGWNIFQKRLEHSSAIKS